MYLQLKKRLQNIINKIPSVVSLCAIVFIWHILSETGTVPSYMLPSPASVVRAFVEDFDIIMRHSKVTLLEAFYGLAIGIMIGFMFSIVMDRFKFMKQALYPIMIVTQTIPTVAIAPILVLWMGFDMEPKIALVVLTTFFPITVGLLDGFKCAEQDTIDLMKSMGASRYKIFMNVKMPYALPHFFSGLRVSVSYAVVGAVISEWLGGFDGLGVYMTRVRKAYAFDKMFAVIIFIIVISLLLMMVVNILKSICIPWIRVEKRREE